MITFSIFDSDAINGTVMIFLSAFIKNSNIHFVAAILNYDRGDPGRLSVGPIECR